MSTYRYTLSLRQPAALPPPGVEGVIVQAHAPFALIRVITREKWVAYAAAIVEATAPGGARASGLGVTLTHDPIAVPESSIADPEVAYLVIGVPNGAVAVWGHSQDDDQIEVLVGPAIPAGESAELVSR